MSGIHRLIVADTAKKGLTGEEAMAEFSPENMRAEKGTMEEEKREGEYTSAK